MGGAPSGHLWVFITFLLLLLSSKVNLLLHHPRLTCLCRFTFFFFAYMLWPQSLLITYLQSLDPVLQPFPTSKKSFGPVHSPAFHLFTSIALLYSSFIE
jgi:hypothetical protein